ncbi:hypothetical protein ABZV65_30730 [Streptomyces bauhiniae]|uniref:hypothetical protein n=1 Tax=Streptomyces bauhiniae TaxID=2340725 RepID=UPI0033B89676
MNVHEVPVRAGNPFCTPESAQRWHDFIAARLLDDLRTEYGCGPDGSGPGPWDYRKALEAASGDLRSFTTAWSGGDPEKIEDAWWGLKNTARPWKAHPDYPEPISDGTMPCPVPEPESGHPCVKRIPRGWTPSEGHGGGHFWEAPKVTELHAAGAHIDNSALLAGQPAKWHLPKDCTPDCWKWRNR